MICKFISAGVSDPEIGIYASQGKQLCGKKPRISRLHVLWSAVCIVALIFYFGAVDKSSCEKVCMFDVIMMHLGCASPFLMHSMTKQI